MTDRLMISKLNIEPTRITTRPSTNYQKISSALEIIKTSENPVLSLAQFPKNFKSNKNSC